MELPDIHLLPPPPPISSEPHVIGLPPSLEEALKRSSQGVTGVVSQNLPMPVLENQELQGNPEASNKPASEEKNSIQHLDKSFFLRLGAAGVAGFSIGFLGMAVLKNRKGIGKSLQTYKNQIMKAIANFKNKGK